MPHWRLPLALGVGLALACRPDQLPTDPSTVQRPPSFAAAVLPSGTIHLPPGLGGSFGSQALALSPTGDIVGYASTPSGFFNAVLWQGGAAIDLGGGPLTPFRASGALGLDVLATNSPTTGIVSCGAVPTIDAIEEVTTSTSGLHYENGQYIYAWKTQPAWKGTCRKFMLNLKDGTQQIALFQFK
jgi:hypothetical protein